MFPISVVDASLVLTSKKLPSSLPEAKRFPCASIATIPSGEKGTVPIKVVEFDGGLIE